MVGIKDIAKEAGVSISTVSYALNNNENTKVSKKTREKILKIAEKMNYVPNMAARTLKKKSTNIVAVYITSYKGYFYSSLLDGISQELNKSNYELIVCSGLETHKFIPERLVDGAIILDRFFLDEEILKLAKQGHYLTVLDRELDSEEIGHILLDNKNGSKEAVEYLVTQPVNHFYIVTGPEGNYDSIRRLEPALKILKENKMSHTVIEGNFTKESGYQAASNLNFKKGEVTAVYCLNDDMAIGFYDFLKDTTLKIGRDVLIVGYDNIELTKYVSPKLASVDYSMFEWGVRAAKILLNQLNGQKGIYEKISTSFNLNESAIYKKNVV